MKILLLHPEDGLDGHWVRERWDQVVDLGRAPASVYDEWSLTLGTRVSSIYDLAVEIDDLRDWRGLIAFGAGHVVDHVGIDWWDVVAIILQRELQDLRLVQRLASKIGSCDHLKVTRPSPLAEALSLELGRRLEVEQSDLARRLARRVARYRRAAADLSFTQFRQVVYDKYDSNYKWRRRFAGGKVRGNRPVVLLPSAYSNVTKTALRYAAVLPEQEFLLMLARESAAISPLPPNVKGASLAAFATSQLNPEELRKLHEEWDRLEARLAEHPDFRLAARLGILRGGRRWLRWGLVVRDAWNNVFNEQHVIGCLSGDDSNAYSRIPLLIARSRNVPAIACHHGALDGAMAFKSPPFSTYLVKGEMERDYLERVCGVDARRLRVAAPAASRASQAAWSKHAPWVVFFSEAYETDFWRTEAIYREVLPRLCALARRSGKSMVLKLHPFESLRQRERMVKQILGTEDRKTVKVTAAPFSDEILRNTWCAVSVESTTAFECATAGIPAFLCGWLRHSYVAYAQQYARYGVARMLEHPDDLLQIPEMLTAAVPRPDIAERLVHPISSKELSEILCQPQASPLR